MLALMFPARVERSKIRGMVGARPDQMNGHKILYDGRITHHAGLEPAGLEPAGRRKPGRVGVYVDVFVVKDGPPSSLQPLEL
jgi:hypothetical protein